MAKNRDKLGSKRINSALEAGFNELMPNVIWQSDDGVYQVFARYQIVPDKQRYTVLRDSNAIGVFNSTRTALSWCIADKYGKQRLAKELLVLDNRLQQLKDDISVRTTAALNSNNHAFKEAVMTKLETKIIRKKQIEFEINKCINTARCCQNQGFNNETIRTGRKTPNR